MRSLVQAAYAKREPRWRLLEAALERMGDLEEDDPEAAPLGRPRALTPEQEAEVVRAYAKKRGTFAALGAQFGVSKDVIKGVLRRARERR